MHHISTHQYMKGVEYLQCNILGNARECFEDALAARLVLYGPDSDEVLATHHQLKCIAQKQGDMSKAAYHKSKIVQVQNARMRRTFQRFAADPIDWSVLGNED